MTDLCQMSGGFEDKIAPLAGVGNRNRNRCRYKGSKASFDATELLKRADLAGSRRTSVVAACSVCRRWLLMPVQAVRAVERSAPGCRRTSVVAPRSRPPER